MNQLLNIFYSGVNENWINAVYIVLVAFAGSALLAAMSLFLPDVQRLLEVMYGEELE